MYFSQQQIGVCLCILLNVVGEHSNISLQLWAHFIKLDQCLSLNTHFLYPLWRQVIMVCQCLSDYQNSASYWNKRQNPTEEFLHHTWQQDNSFFVFLEFSKYIFAWFDKKFFTDVHLSFPKLLCWCFCLINFKLGMQCIHLVPSQIKFEFCHVWNRVCLYLTLPYNSVLTTASRARIFLSLIFNFLTKFDGIFLGSIQL